MADNMIVGYSIQLANNKALLESVRPILELGLNREAERNSLTLVDDDFHEHIVYETLVETGEVYLDEDGIERPMKRWQETSEEDATYIRITLEGKAERHG